LSPEEWPNFRRKGRRLHEWQGIVPERIPAVSPWRSSESENIIARFARYCKIPMIPSVFNRCATDFKVRRDVCKELWMCGLPLTCATGRKCVGLFSATPLVRSSLP
jgi:hypothetical protein